jgi:transposase
VFAEIVLPVGDVELSNVDIEGENRMLQMRVRSKESSSQCPYCGAWSTQVHSWYERQLKDIPCGGYGIQITLEVRRFFCRAQECKRKTFAERLPKMTQPYARRTNRLETTVQTFGLMVGSTMSNRLLRQFQIEVSKWAILRTLRKSAPCPRATPRILGVDDWAIRRGHRYGTLLVNLENGEVVDVLLGREAQTLTEWLRAHPGIEVVSRDRAGAYAEGARQGAPEAIQVADRWHLLKNAGEMVMRVLDHHHRVLKTFQQTPMTSQPEAANMSPPTEPASPEPTVNPNSRRYTRFTQVHELRSQGFTVSAIARQTSMDRNTVRKYLNLKTLPAYHVKRRRFSKLLPYEPYLLEHWQQGRRTIRQLWRDIQALGFKGSLAVVATFMAQVRKERGLPAYVRTELQCPTPPLVLSPRRAAWLLLAQSDQLDEHEQNLRSMLPTLHPDIHLVAAFAQRFAQIVRDRLPDALDDWMQYGLQSTLREVRAFARGIQRDYAAVKAALSLPWSNGMVEGHVNRLKFVKRQMFGRANFDLLRLRVLA